MTRFSTSLGVRGLRAMGRLNVPIYRATAGRVLGKVNRAPVLLLTTTGRRSGRRRTAPVCYLQDGDRLIVIGSNAGNVTPPAWALNLKANPDAEVEVGRERKQVTARVAAGEEREELWRKMNDQYSGFDRYKQRTDRDIALFVLDPRR
jgi:deazaflavin-dependent oxidoreductase (nitroreductase family)